MQRVASKSVEASKDRQILKNLASLVEPDQSEMERLVDPFEDSNLRESILQPRHRHKTRAVVDDDGAEDGALDQTETETEAVR